MTDPRILVTRVAEPMRTTAHDEITASVTAQVGGQWSWDWAIPLVYRVLAAPTAANPMPVAPRRETDAMDAVGYWNALHHLLTYSLGWSRHDRGLRAWYDAAKPTDDIRFALLEHIWDRDGPLDDYVAWAHERAPYVAEVHGKRVGSADPLSDRWMRRVLGKNLGDAAGTTAFGKHLERHWRGPWEPSAGSTHWSVDAADRRATLIVEHASGWMRALRDHGDALPFVAEHAWRVDVIAKTIGFLGTYRRSWSTDIWFAGPHRLHAWGN